mgnify:CR=1 FL=1
MDMEFVEGIRCIVPKYKESSESLSKKVLNTLFLLREIDESLFTEWYEQGNSKKEALNLKLSLDIDSIEKIVLKEWDKKFPDLGSNFIFWSGKNNDLENTNISFRIGLLSQNKNLNNRVVISFPMAIRIRKNDERINRISIALSQIWRTKEIEVL